jgi:hypothetical protein
MQYLNILTDGLIHEKMRRKSALDRINMEHGTIENTTINLLSIFLDGCARSISLGGEKER